MAKYKDRPEYPIIYKGKTYNTTIRKEVSDEAFEEARAEYYTRPNKGEVIGQLVKIAAGQYKMDKVTNYYFKDVMSYTICSGCNWSIHDVFTYKPLFEFFAGKCAASPRFYPDTLSLCQNITVAFRLCGWGTASKPPQFPLKAADEIIQKYNVNGRYYDYACGWGARLLSSLRNNVHYFGTDPNDMLTPRLQLLADDYRAANAISNEKLTADIRCIGSEEFIPEWEGTMGLAFSSPPYFDMENYQIGKQSYVEGVTTIDSWIDDYVKPTIDNIYRYLIPGGYMAVNVKDTRKFPLRQIWHDILMSKGFSLVDIHTLKNHHRPHGHAEWNADDTCTNKCGVYNSDEKIYVYKKS